MAGISTLTHGRRWLAANTSPKYGVFAVTRTPVVTDASYLRAPTRPDADDYPPG
jgi:hypothetical protein